MTLPLLFLIQEADHAADAGGLPAPFSPTPGLFIWTIIVFVGLLFVLSRFVYPALVKMTAEREAAINQQLAEAKQAQEDAKAVLEEQRGLLADARGQATALVAEARDAADRERSDAVAKTKAEQDEILARAKQEIVNEKERAKAEIRLEAVDIAIAAAGKVIGEKLDADSDRKIVEDYIEQIGSNT